MKNINVEENMGIVINTIKRMFGSISGAHAIAIKNNMQYDDLVQVGTIGLWKAAERFDESKGCTFSTFAYKYVQGYILNLIQESSMIKISKRYYTTEERNEIKNSFTSINTQIGESEGDTLEQMLMDDNQFEESIDKSLDTRNLLSHLDENKQKIIMYRMNGYSYKQIAEKLGTTHKAVEFHYRTTMKKLQEELKPLKDCYL